MEERALKDERDELMVAHVLSGAIDVNRDAVGGGGDDDDDVDDNARSRS